MKVEEYILKDGKKLRLGYTTGSCAAAASKAAAIMLFTGKPKEKITLITPSGKSLNLDVTDIEMGHDFVSCAIEKDGGDDPDITTGSLIFSKVKFTDRPGVEIRGGEGVGKVTKPGLDQPVGEAAINSVPRIMIKGNIEEVCRLYGYEGGLSVTISVPGGEELAKKTFNPKLGIMGGISIIGTTGIVEPMSEQALIDTFIIELKQKKAQGMEYALITPGNYGIDFIRDGLGLNPEKAVRVSNYIGDAVISCKDIGFKGALLVGHIGKLVKLGGDIWNTHSKYGDHRMEILASCGEEAGVPENIRKEILDCVTTDDALRVLSECGNLKDEVLNILSRRIQENFLKRVSKEMEFGAILFSRTEGFLTETKGAKSLIKRIED